MHAKRKSMHFMGKWLELPQNTNHWVFQSIFLQWKFVTRTPDDLKASTLVQRVVILSLGGGFMLRLIRHAPFGTSILYATGCADPQFVWCLLRRMAYFLPQQAPFAISCVTCFCTHHMHLPCHPHAFSCDPTICFPKAIF